MGNHHLIKAFHTILQLLTAVTHSLTGDYFSIVPQSIFVSLYFFFPILIFMIWFVFKPIMSKWIYVEDSDSVYSTYLALLAISLPSQRGL